MTVLNLRLLGLGVLKFCLAVISISDLVRGAQNCEDPNPAPESIGFDTLPYNFTLAAANASLANAADLTGAPLVLGAGGATGGVMIYVTSTYSSFPYNQYPTLGLVNRALRAFDDWGNWCVNATTIRSGERLVWSRSVMYPNPEDNSRVYSVIQTPSNPYPVLAAHNVSTLWSLCPFPGPRAQTQLVFNVSAVRHPPDSDYLPFDPDLCYHVMLHIIPAGFSS
ncbi:hypothetical protein CC1G_07340 [Coprinopsis cinerea okayama7|uniref:Uncharacterized protein n=1 Tax=Coprinopsis cinerea (strain Okayama-7 / 130 / ATCC MYA-4618 / FGSC 9003) TaxID=240176 RepID=A8NNT5_COPC7|nr:hypothetical protein CC1G_07340 [Coprinopsis cinerea okayama7\|eukprot:XP_001835198.2 hypothetical protein CC1G_07340 [Coprinopsis cinerea okayama7\